MSCFVEGFWACRNVFPITISKQKNTNQKEAANARALFKLIDWEREIDFAGSKKDCKMPISQYYACIKIFFFERLDCQSKSARNLYVVALTKICKFILKVRFWFYTTLNLHQFKQPPQFRLILDPCFCSIPKDCFDFVLQLFHRLIGLCSLRS